MGKMTNAIDIAGGWLYLENCIDTMNNMNPGTVDLIVTSPPYDDYRSYDGYDPTNHFEFSSVAHGIKRILKPGGVCVWIVGDQVRDHSESGTSFRQALGFMDIGLKLFDTMIYKKKGVTSVGHDSYYQVFEYMFIISKGTPKTINPICDRPNKYPGDLGRGKQSRRQHDGGFKLKKHKPTQPFGKRYNIWEYDVGYDKSSKDKLAFLHPAIFPEQLAADHIISWSNPGDLVYDPFMGSGTVAKMCHIHGRAWYGSEISHKYCEVIKARLAQERFDSVYSEVPA